MTYKAFRDKPSTTLACFSPPVMIATFVIEAAFAIYTLIKHRDKLWGKIILLILVCLAVFQLAEFQVCGGVSELVWAKVGFMAITLLPPLGISLSHVIAGKSLKSKFHIGSWILAGAFITSFLFSALNQAAPVCNGNYIIFSYDYLFTNGFVYGLYYYGLLFAAIITSYVWSKKTSTQISKLLSWQILGYSVFIIPTVAVNLVASETITAIPSIMCGFAVAWALILMFAIMPKLAKLKSVR